MQNNNQPSIKEQLKQRALNNAIKQKEEKQNTPSWVLPTSWCIGGVVSIIIKSAIASNMDMGTSPSEAFALIILGSIVGLFVVLCSYHLLLALCSVAVSAKKGAGTIVKATSQELDTITSAVAKKVTKAIEIRCPNLVDSELLSNSYYRSTSFRHNSHSFGSTVRSSSYSGYSGGSGGFGYGGGGRGGGGGGGGH
jgi:uncharacterized membrane protein YgcG